MSQEPKRKYWYRITHYYCPLCGHDSTYRERVYDQAESGHHWIESWDYCGV